MKLKSLLALFGMGFCIATSSGHAGTKYEIPRFIDPSDPNYLVIYKKLNPAGSYLKLGEPAPDPAYCYIGWYMVDPLIQLKYLDTIEYEVVGDYSAGRNFPDNSGNTVGSIFGNTLTQAIYPGPDIPVQEFVTPPVKEKTDEDFDFAIRKNILNKAQVPINGVYNGFTVSDIFMGDNTDPNQNFGVFIRIRKRYPVNNFNNLNYNTGSPSTTGFDVIPSPLKPFKN